MQVLPIKIPEEMYKNLRLLKEETGISMAQFIRQQIQKPLREKTKKLKAQESLKEKKRQKNRQLVTKLAGGLKLGKGYSPEEMNKLYDKHNY